MLDIDYVCQQATKVTFYPASHSLNEWQNCLRGKSFSFELTKVFGADSCQKFFFCTWSAVWNNTNKWVCLFMFTCLWNSYTLTNLTLVTEKYAVHVSFYAGWRKVTESGTRWSERISAVTPNTRRADQLHKKIMALKLLFSRHFHVQVPEIQVVNNSNQTRTSRETFCESYHICKLNDFQSTVDVNAREERKRYIPSSVPTVAAVAVTITYWFLRQLTQFLFLQNRESCRKTVRN